MNQSPPADTEVLFLLLKSCRSFAVLIISVIHWKLQQLALEALTSVASCAAKISDFFQQLLHQVISYYSVSYPQFRSFIFSVSGEE
jgi:hypothetical protein